MDFKKKPANLHFYLDEAGDTTFYGKKRRVIVGEQGVSRWFLLGMVHFDQPIEPLKKALIKLTKMVENDKWYAGVPSVQKKIRDGGFYFHATDDPAEVRKMFFEFISKQKCHFEAVAGLKVPERYQTVHGMKEGAFYAELLSHCIEPYLDRKTLVLNIAHRGKTTKNVNLENALLMATNRAQNPKKAEVVFNIQTPITEPLLMIADYCCWAVQRELEKDEPRYLNYIRGFTSRVDKIFDFKT